MRLQKKLIITLSVAAIVLVAAFITVRLIRGPHDLKSALAVALHLPSEQAADFFVNLPPAASRYPGAIMVAPKMLVLEESTANDQGIVQGTSFTLTASDSTLADAVSSFRSSALTGAAHDKDDVGIEIEISGGQVLEMPVPDLKRKLLESDAAKSAANHGTDPLIITRSYVGILTFVLRQKSAAGAQLLAKASKSSDLASDASIKMDANRLGQGILRVTVDQSVVFAFEASSATYLTQHLGATPDDVNLTPVSPASLYPKDTQGNTARPNVVPWTLATVASGYYENLRTLNQSWNAESADLIEDALRPFQPSTSLQLRATEEKPITEADLTSFIVSVREKAKASNSRFILFYYIGHTLSWPNRDIALILGDAKSIPDTTRAGSNRAIHRQLGDKVGSLFDLADALQANLEQLPRGFMPLREVYAEMDKAGIPFAILVDGCLRNDEFEKLRSELGIIGDSQTRTFFYVGPDDRLLSSVDEFDDALRHFADTLPYLHSSNPVIMAAKPGTFAQPWTDPRLSWTPAGPLAARLYHYIRASVFDVEQPSLGEALSNVTEYKGTGEISPKGSVSWSDFGEIKDILTSAKPLAM